MSDDSKGRLGGRFGSGFASLRQQAEKLSNNVSSQVSEMNTKMQDAATKIAATSDSTEAAALPPASVEKPSKSGGLANATREELVEVLQKMSKKVKALSALRAQLSGKLQTTEEERDKLILFSKEEVLKGVDVTTIDDKKSLVPQLQLLWKTKEEQDTQQVEQLKALLRSSGEDRAAPSKSNGQEVETLKAQLKQEHDRETKALKHEIAKLKEGIAVTSERKPSTPAGDMNTSELEALKVKHAEEMKKIKTAATLQLQNFKKKVAAARAAELEKVKAAAEAETRAKMEEEKREQDLPAQVSGDQQQASNSAATNDLKKQNYEEIEKIKIALKAEQANALNQASEQHEREKKKLGEMASTKLKEEVERTRDIIQQAAKKQASAQTEKLLSTMNLQGKEHQEELDKMRAMCDKRVKEAVERLENQEKGSKDLSSKLQETRDSLKKSQDANNVAIEKLKMEFKQQSEKREVDWTEKLHRQAKKSAAAVSVGDSKETELKLKTELTSQFEVEKKKIQEQQKSEMQKLRTEMSASTDKKMKELEANTEKIGKSMAEAKTVELKTLQKSLEDKFAAEKASLAKYHSTQIEKLKTNLANTSTKQAETMKSSAGKERQLMAQQKETELKNLRMRLSESFGKEKLALEKQHNAAIENLNCELSGAAKKQIAGLRKAAEDEKMKLASEHEKNVSEAIEMTTAGLLKTHKEELVKVMNEAEERKSGEMSEMKKKLAEQTKLLQEKAEKQKMEAVKAVEAEVVKTTTEKFETTIKEMKQEVEKSKSGHKQALSKHNEESAKKIQAAEQRTTELEKKLKEVTKELKTTKNQIQNNTAENEKNFDSLKKELQAEAQSTLEKSKKSIISQAEKENAQKLDKLKKDKDIEIKALQNTLANEKESELKKLATSHSSQLEGVKKELESEMKEKMKQFSKGAMQKKEKELEEIKKQADARLSKEKSTIENNFEQQIISVRKEELEKLTKALEVEKSKAKEAMDKASKSFEKQSRELQAASKKKSDALDEAACREKSLQDKVQGLEQKICAFDDEKKAIMAAAKDGEKNSQNAVHESLRKQRESFEKILKDQTNSHGVQVKSLNDKILKFDEVLSTLNEKKESMEIELKKNVESLKAEKTKTEEQLENSKKFGKEKHDSLSKMQDTEKVLKTQNEKLSEDLKIACKKHETEVTSLNDKVSKLDKIIATLNEKVASKEAEFKEGVDAAKAENTKTEKELEISKKLIRDMSDKSSKVQGTEKALKTQNEKLSEDIKIASNKHATVVKSLNDKVCKLDKTMSALHDKLELKEAEYKKGMEAAKAETTNAERELEVSKKLVKDMSDSSSKMQGTEKELKTQNEKLADVLKSSGKKHKTEVKSLTDKVAELDKTITILNENLVSKEAEYEKRMEAAKAEKTKIDQELEVAKKLMKDTSDRSSKMQGAEKALKQKNEILVEELKKLRSNLELEVEKTSKKSSDSKAEVSNLKSSLSNLKKEFVGMKDQYETANKKLQKAEAAHVPPEKLKQLETDVSTKTKELLNVKTSHEKQMKELSEKLTKISKEKSKVDEQVKDLADFQARQAMERESQVQKLELQQRETMKKSEDSHAAAKKKLKEGLEAQSKETETLLKIEIEDQAKKHAKELKQLKDKMADHVDKMKGQLMSKLTEEREKSKAVQDAMTDKDSKRDEKVNKVAAQLKTISETAKKGQEERIQLQKLLEKESAAKKKLTEELESQKKQLKEAESRTKTTEDSLKQNQTASEKSASNLETMNEMLNAKTNQVEELAGKLNALTTNLNIMAEDVKEKDDAVAQAKAQKAKLESSETDMENMRREMNKLKLELTKSSQLTNRLQSEKEASEQIHGQRTARMGMLENHLAEVNEKNTDVNAKLEAAMYDVSQKNESLETLKQDMKDVQDALSLAVKEKKEYSENSLQAQKGAAKRNNMMTESLQRELQQLQQSSARKSAAAQKLIQEKESECTDLRVENRKLKQEVDKGSLSDRKIFELAEMQSNRESAQATEIEVRDSALERLKAALLKRDGDLATAEKVVQEVEMQVEELCRVKRREDVNMDYLKSIIVQFLSKPPGTSERSALLPVLATLLQFDTNDYNLIEQGKQKLSWFGTVDPVMIGGDTTVGSVGESAAAAATTVLGNMASLLAGTAATTAPAAPPTGPMVANASAEVSISNDQAQTKNSSSRTTSLQF